MPSSTLALSPCFSTVVAALLLAPLAASASTGAAAPAASAAAAPATVNDPHSFARPAEARVTHLDLDLDVDFATKALSGTATLKLATAAGATHLLLDTNGLIVRRARAGKAADALVETPFRLGEPVEHLGRALDVTLPAGATMVAIDYATGPQAAALQWLEPQQTAGGKHPFLFTQSQAILARTWIPCQDTPAVRMTYSATVRVPAGLLALMSASNPQKANATGEYEFEMPQAIPSYLMALAVGDMAFRPIGADTGVYAEVPMVERVAWELADTQKMLEAANRRWGGYRWGRYDVLVLPPSFPFGGMENPRLTFATPTIIAGDRSLVSLVAHELAHSWSGNLVTNATWNDFWLNEGFTDYVERRIMEDLYGEAYADMLGVLGRQELQVALDELPPADTRLKLDLTGRDPDDGMTQIAYEKGALFLKTLEEAVGRAKWDPFLKGWFESHAFRSASTEEFLAYLDKNLLGPLGKTREQLQIDAWINGPGVPPNAAKTESTLLAQVDAELGRWDASIPASQLKTTGWSTQQWVHFITHLPKGITAQQLATLDEAFKFSSTGNSEILFYWLQRAIQAGYEPAYPAVERFLTSMGRRRFLRPLYQALAATPEGAKKADAIYAKARPTYHPAAVKLIDGVLGWKDGAPPLAR